MLALYDCIQELRLELAHNQCPREREEITRELATAETAHAAEQSEFLDWFEAPD